MEEAITNYYRHIMTTQNLPANHVCYLRGLKRSGFDPKVIYDIGSCVLHWTVEAQKIWPEAEIVLFEANPYCEHFYGNYKRYIGLLSNESHLERKFYFNEFSPGGASYYREIGSPESYKFYSAEKYLLMKTLTLDEVVTTYSFPLPDLVKMDVQGAERDVLLGGKETLKQCQRLILELPKDGVEYNLGAPSAKETMSVTESMGFTCCDPLFSDNGVFDGDYGFVRS